MNNAAEISHTLILIDVDYCFEWKISDNLHFLAYLRMRPNMFLLRIKFINKSILSFESSEEDWKDKSKKNHWLRLIGKKDQKSKTSQIKTNITESTCS